MKHTKNIGSRDQQRCPLPAFSALYLASHPLPSNPSPFSSSFPSPSPHFLSHLLIAPLSPFSLPPLALSLIAPLALLAAIRCIYST